MTYFKDPAFHTELNDAFTDILQELEPDDFEQLISNNVPFEDLGFFQEHAEAFAQRYRLPHNARQELPKLLLMGYLLRLLEERIVEVQH